MGVGQGCRPGSLQLKPGFKHVCTSWAHALGTCTCRPPLGPLGTGGQQWPSLGSKREVGGQEPQLRQRAARLPQGDSARTPRGRSSGDLSPAPPEPTPGPEPHPRCPHHAVGKSEAIRVGDDLQEDVHGVQYVGQEAVFAIFADNLQENTEWVQGEGRLSSRVEQDLCTAGSCRPRGQQAVRCILRTEPKARI